MAGLQNSIERWGPCVSHAPYGSALRCRLRYRDSDYALGRCASAMCQSRGMTARVGCSSWDWALPDRWAVVRDHPYRASGTRIGN
jgi:hypothetical protein